jgi:hypothetical protein
MKPLAPFFQNMHAHAFIFVNSIKNIVCAMHVHLLLVSEIYILRYILRFGIRFHTVARRTLFET